MIAVIKTGGKQYIVKENEELKVEKISKKEGSAVEFEVLLLANEDGTDVSVGMPVLEGASVHAQVIDEGRGKKVTVVKFKPKVRFRRKSSHRQAYSKVKITKTAKSK